MRSRWKVKADCLDLFTDAWQRPETDFLVQSRGNGLGNTKTSDTS